MKIYSNLPKPPPKFAPWTRILREMNPGDGFIVSTRAQQSSVISKACRAGIKIHTQKIDGVGIGIWKLKDKSDGQTPVQKLSDADGGDSVRRKVLRAPVRNL